MVFGCIMGIVGLLEFKGGYFSEPTRICFSFIFGAIGRIAFDGIIHLVERLRDNPKALIGDIISIIPKELLGDVLDLIKRRYFSEKKDDDQTTQNP